MEEVLNIVKERLELSDNSLDGLIKTYINEICQRIKHYCNIDRIPKELNFIWASMVIDVLKVEQSSIDEIANVIDERQSVRIGDTSVSPSKSEGVTSTSKRIIEDIVLNYRTDLNAYRKLRW